MPRDLDPSLAAAYESGYFIQFYALQIQFVSQSFYLWSGPWNLNWNGQTWLGLGNLGKLGGVTETGEIQATGTSVALSGVNQAILQEALDDVWIGAPAVIYEGVLDPTTRQPIGAPQVYFRGLVDKPSVSNFGPDGDCSISLALESRFIRLNQGSRRRFTQADQRLRFPLDTFFVWVESLNDNALRWGT